MNKEQELICAIAKILVCRLKSHSNPRVEYLPLSNMLNGLEFNTTARSLDNSLGALSDYCKDIGLPPLSALVVNNSTKFPGDGYFRYFYSHITDESLWEGVWRKDFEEVIAADWVPLIEFLQLDI